MRVVRQLAALVPLSLLATGSARAEPVVPAVAPAADAKQEKKDAKDAEEPHARGGLVIGVAGGLAMGTASGYPNDLQKIDDPAWYSAGGFLIGESAGGFVMGAFAKQLNFGVFVTQSAARSGSGVWRSRAYGGGFRVEVFPFGWLVPALRDLGVMGQFGVGSGDLKPTDAQSTWPGADGVQSYIGVGLFHELVFAHPGKTRWALGPSVEYQLISSRPFERSTLIIGIRVAFYSGP